MFIWKKKERIGAKKNLSFTSISKKIGANQKSRINFTFSEDFKNKFGIDNNSLLIVGFDKEMNRIGLVKTKSDADGYKVCKNSGSMTSSRVSVTIELPFSITRLDFNTDEVFEENGIIIYELSNKDIASNFK